MPTARRAFLRACLSAPATFPLAYRDARRDPPAKRPWHAALAAKVSAAWRADGPSVDALVPLAALPPRRRWAALVGAVNDSYFCGASAGRLRFRGPAVDMATGGASWWFEILVDDSDPLGNCLRSVWKRDYPAGDFSRIP